MIPPTGDAPTRLGAALLAGIGGRRGALDGALPTVVFAAVNAAVGLVPGVVAAGALGAVLAVARLVRRQPPQQALAGLVGLGIACAWALHAHRATAFYLPGIVVTGALAVLLCGSVVVRQPLVGVVAGQVSHEVAGWRERPRLRRALVGATIVWGAFHVVSFAIRLVLYATGHATTLGAARLLLGYPSTLALLAVSVVMVRAGLRAEARGQAGGSGVGVAGAAKTSAS